jgi:hypothetical protein
VRRRDHRRGRDLVIDQMGDITDHVLFGDG